MSLTCARGCVQRDRHLTQCPCADPHHEHAEPTTATYQGPLEDAPGWSCHWCTGCLPRVAATGLAVCPGCERAVSEGLAELPDLWVDLAERPRLAGLSRAPQDAAEPPAPTGDDQIAERSVIKSILVTWCKVLEEDHAISVPDERAIAATTRQIAAWDSDMARQARNAAGLLEVPTTGPLIRNHVGAAELRRQSFGYLSAAAAARDDRETGRDVLRAICEHLRRHSATLLAGPHAAKYAADVRDARADARRKAYATTPERLTVPCPACGRRNKARLDQDGDITCNHCGNKGDARWWGANAEHEPMNLAALRAYLGTEGLYPTERQLRSWADKGKLESTRPGRASDGKMQDRLFDPLKSLHVVAELLAHKRHERRVA